MGATGACGSRRRRFSDGECVAQVTAEPLDESRFWHIDGQMYDLDAWKHRHPGGAYILDAARGTDCTAAYHTYHALADSDSIEPVLAKFWRGPSMERTRAKEAPDALFEELRTEVKAYAAEHGYKAVDSGWFVAWSTLWLFIYCWACVCWMVSPTAAVVVAMTAGLWFCAADGLHSGTHAALTYSRVGDMYGRMVGTLFCLPSAWMRQHVLGHHTDINVKGVDPDVAHHACGWHGWRTSPIQTWRTMYRFWRQYAPVNMMFTSFVPSMANSARMLWSGRYPGARNAIAWAPGERGALVATYGVVAAALGAHAYVHGCGWTLAPFAACGVVYYVCSQVSHINTPSFARAGPEARAAKPPSWSVAQVGSCAGDYSTESVATGLLTIGLNNQAIHHLFPSVHHVHYPFLAPRFARIVRRHVPGYDVKTHTFAQSLVQHFGHLARMNDTGASCTRLRQDRKIKA